MASPGKRLIDSIAYGRAKFPYYEEAMRGARRVLAALPPRHCACLTRGPAALWTFVPSDVRLCRRNHDRSVDDCHTLDGSRAYREHALRLDPHLEPCHRDHYRNGRANHPWRRLAEALARITHGPAFAHCDSRAGAIVLYFLVGPRLNPSSCRERNLFHICCKPVLLPLTFFSMVKLEEDAQRRE